MSAKDLFGKESDLFILTYTAFMVFLIFKLSFF